MLLTSLLLLSQWIVPARELFELQSRNAPLVLPESAWELKTGRGVGNSGELFTCTEDSILVRLALEPMSGNLEVHVGDQATPVRSVQVSELFSASERFSNTNPPSLGKPLLFRAGERVSWRHEGPGRFDWALRVPAATAPASQAANAVQLSQAREAFSAAPQLPDGTLAFQYSLSELDPAGTLLCVDDKRARGPACISSIVLRVDGPQAEENVKFIFVRMRFDGEETLVAPLLALFRSVELDPRMRARSGRDFALRWKMPYKEKVDFLIENLGPPTTHVSGSLYTSPWHWDERSLHFAAAWLPARESVKLSVMGTGALLGIAPAVATRETFFSAAKADGRDLEIASGIARLDRLLFEKELRLEVQAPGQALALLGLRPGAKLSLREAHPGDWELLSKEP